HTYHALRPIKGQKWLPFSFKELVDIMLDDPETSAVNNYLQMWDAENLFVLGASAPPLFAGRQPTATVGALAYRAAEGIEKHLEDGGMLTAAKQDKVKKI